MRIDELIDIKNIDTSIEPMTKDQAIARMIMFKTQIHSVRLSINAKMRFQLQLDMALQSRTLELARLKNQRSVSLEISLVFRGDRKKLI